MRRKWATSLNNEVARAFLDHIGERARAGFNDFRDICWRRKLCQSANDYANSEAVDVMLRNKIFITTYS